MKHHLAVARCHWEPHSLTTAEAEVLDFILPLSPDYPGIEDWFRLKVVPGLSDGTRKIVRIERHGRIAALGIGKCQTDEQKICTVRVAPDFYGRGLGLRVFETLMSWMGNSQPHLTVSEDKLPEFERIFDYYSYRLTSVHNSRYRAGKAEYLFNESKSLLK